MALTLQSIPMGLVKVPVFERLVISQAADGSMSVDGTYRVELRNESGEKVTDLESVSFGMNQAQLLANPNFASTYPVLRDLARSGLALVAAELVAQN